MDATATPAACLRVLLVDDHPLVLEGIRGLLRRDAGVRIVAAATSGAEALRQLRQLARAAANAPVGVPVSAPVSRNGHALASGHGHAAPDAPAAPGVDVAFIDLHMFPLGGLELMRQLRVEFPALRLLALSMNCDLTTVRDVLAVGAAGYVLKTALGPELGLAVRRAAAGHTFFSPDIAALLLDAPAPPARAAPGSPASLTPREVEILHLVAAEHSNERIADRLHISERTVETHRKNILTKTGCKSMVGLMQYALRHQLL